MKKFSGDLAKNTVSAADRCLTMGNFDGVHRGHQFLLRQAGHVAKDMGLQLSVLTFWPHPEVFFGKPFDILSSQAQRMKLLEGQGVNEVFEQSFTNDFSALGAAEFLDQWVLNILNPKVLYFGYDFRFGKGGEGDFDFAEKYLQGKGIRVVQGEAFREGNQTISSSVIRRQLSDGDVVKAGHGLGRCYSVRGTVVAGEGLGRKLGFPTANIDDIQTMVPKNGVYLGWIDRDEKKLPSLMNIGVRPSVSDSSRKTCEIHVLDYTGDLYNQELQFNFLRHMRDEISFAGPGQLIAQIEDDVLKARELLKGMSL